jgi:hypothetical protein
LGTHRESFAPAGSRRFALHFRPTGVIHVVTAVITAKGENQMKTIVEENANAPAAAEGEQPKAAKKATRAPRRAPVAPAKTKSGKKATPAKKAPKGRTRAKAAEPEVAREGSKTARILELLKRPGGVTAKDLLKATNWLPHSVRGFLSGTVGKKMGLTVTSTKGEDGERTYSVKA